MTARAGAPCGCRTPSREVLLEFDGGPVNLVCAACGREVDVEAQDLFSDAMPMTLTLKEDVDEHGAPITWWELAPRPPDRLPS